MRNTSKFVIGLTAFVLALYGFGILGARQGWFWDVDFQFEADDIGGFVSGPNGPEAGAWVIAEARDSPGHYIRIVVTDERGRYVLPDLPQSIYDIWVHAYGLDDSPKQQSLPGQMLNLTAGAARAEATTPQRPQGVERNLVLTLMDAPSQSAASSEGPFIDRNDTLGLGPETSVRAEGDALVAITGGKMVTFRVPYPPSLYLRAVDGRIDDANAGWKGRGLSSVFSGGADENGKTVHFQLRPDPLAH